MASRTWPEPKASVKFAAPLASMLRRSSSTGLLAYMNPSMGLDNGVSIGGGDRLENTQAMLAFT